jgi:hypothetical protein
MAKSLLLAWATPASPEAEAEFHSWYDQTHIPELRAAIPSITAAHRYQLRPLGPMTAQPDAPAGRFLCVYELDEADVETAAAALGAALASGRISRTETMDTTAFPPALEWYQHL